MTRRPLLIVAAAVAVAAFLIAGCGGANAQPQTDQADRTGNPTPKPGGTEGGQAGTEGGAPR